MPSALDTASETAPIDSQARVIFNKPDKPAYVTISFKIRIDKADILDGDVPSLALISRPYRRKQPHMGHHSRISKQARNRIALSVERALEIFDHIPLRKFCRIRHIQGAVFAKNVLVHHNVVDKLRTRHAILGVDARQNSKRAVHKFSKTVEFPGSRNQITAVFISIRQSRDNRLRLRGMRNRGKQCDCNKRDYFFCEHNSSLNTMG